MMVYNTQNYFIRHPEFEKLENTTFQKLDLFLSSGEGRKTPCWVP
jgi:hypothetical protein